MGTKLNVGCGPRRIAGYLGVDIKESLATDIVAPAHKIPLPDASVDKIFACHLWEHFYYWECPKVMTEWRRLLKPSGNLTLELPNVRKCCENLLNNLQMGGKHPHQLSYWGLYGDPRFKDPYMCHRWGWTPETLTAFLTEYGFVDIKEEPTEYHPAGRDFRDMRLSARKA
jgi:predicted SAM-dependent methyltransferase